MVNWVFNGLKMEMIEPKTSSKEDIPILSLSRGKSVTIEAKLDYVNKPLLDYLAYTRFYDGLEYPYDLFDLARFPDLIERIAENSE